MGKGKYVNINEYALYRGEKLVATGTVHKIANELGIKVQTIRKYGTPSYKRSIVNEEDGTILINLGKGGDEDEQM